MSMTHTAAQPLAHEPSAWMRQRLAYIEREVIRRLGGTPPDDHVVVTALGLTFTQPDSAADRQCDRCGYYVPLGADLFTFMAKPTPWLHVVGGLCVECVGREGIAHE